jgi:phosphotransferase system enzyme I (PtsI)
MKTKAAGKVLRGVPMSRGIAIGKPFFFICSEDAVPEQPIAKDQIELEIERYRKALSQSQRDVKRLQLQLKEENALEAAAILETHLQIMQDPLLTTMIESEIRKTCKNAESVFHTCHLKYQKKFHAIRDPFFRERDKDLEDISRRIMGHLRESTRISLADIPKNSIVFARELSASDAAAAKPGTVIAFVTESGGVNSHAAIVARAKGIPYIAKAKLDQVEHLADSTVIVDARTGEIHLNPSPKLVANFQNLQKQLKSHFQTLEKTSTLEAETFDGYKMRLSANIETVTELDLLHQYRANGVGLFRSEYIFLSKQNFPSEDEQFEIYKRVVQRMEGLPIVIRTFDVGGDKLALSQDYSPDVNPYLGMRAIRFLLQEQNIFRTQLRAILRASVYGEVRIMFPMISGLGELQEAKHLVREIENELKASGIELKKQVPVGCMIEVPAAAIIADILARESDFLSIGTNDLVQYTLAVDRSHQAASSTFTPMHPGVIRLIKHVVAMANRYGKPVTVCGEIAADPRFTPLLMGLGVHELSVASRHLPFVKHAIRNTSIISAIQLAEKVMEASNANEIQEMLNTEYKRTVPEDFFHNIA